MASYIRPLTLTDALGAMASGARTLLAGGTDHYPARASFEPAEDILDLTGIAGLQRIRLCGTIWRIPALATWTSLIETELPPLFAGLQAAARQIGGRQVQNRGTIAGNICNASPAADGVPALLALDASVELASLSGVRNLPLQDYVLGPRRTARRPDEMVTAILVPDSPARSTFAKLGGRRYLVISITMAAVSLVLDQEGRVAGARVAVGACGPVATRLPALEAALLGQAPHPALVRPEHLAPLCPIDDVRAPAAYRMQATAELLCRALTQ